MMLTVAIPALNEAANIRNVIMFAQQHPAVQEVIVVDDGSTDDTAHIAATAGATVLTSSLLGKGPSMHDALLHARTPYILYLDGDMRFADTTLISRMLTPLERGATFVKASFARASGRVTELTARPLLKALFPELSTLSQPLGGIMAAHCDLLKQMKFEDDFGVDIGLLIDAHTIGAIIEEVDVGAVEHDSKPLAGLSRMASEVSRAILQRAESSGRLHASRLADAIEVQRQREADLDSISSCIVPGGKIALFDMDGTLLQGRFISHLAQQAGFEDQLSRYLDNHHMDAATRSSGIARLLTGLSKQLLADTARSIPLQPGAAETVIQLRRMGYQVGVLSDSYFIAAELTRRRIFADFAIGHILNFSNNQATGEMAVNPLFRHPMGCQKHAICKLNVLQHLVDFAGAPFAHTVMTGDGENDLCLIQEADQGFSFHPKTPALLTVGTQITDLREIPNLIKA